MSDGSSGGSSLILDGYSLEPTPQEEPSAASFDAAPSPQTPIRITLRGRWFKIAAVDPKIMIGGVELQDYEIMSDESTIVGYLHEIPEENSVISIDYGRGIRAEMPERFSLSKLSES